MRRPPKTSHSLPLICLGETCIRKYLGRILHMRLCVFNVLYYICIYFRSFFTQFTQHTWHFHTISHPKFLCMYSPKETRSVYVWSRRAWCCECETATTQFTIYVRKLCVVLTYIHTPNKQCVCAAERHMVPIAKRDVEHSFNERRTCTTRSPGRSVSRWQDHKMRKSFG